MQNNQTTTIKNSQKIIVKRTLYVALFSLMITIIPPMALGGADWIFALSFVGIIAFFSSLGVAWMYHARANKLQSLIDEEELIARWRLSPEQKAKYAQQMFEAQKAKNKILFSIMVVMFVIIFTPFILFGDEDARMPMFLSMVGFIAFLSIFAFGMPYYYRRSNLNSDGEILIGGKYAYVDGHFHNWDFPLSGLEDVKVIQKPFYGIHLRYYYTDRTLRNSFEMNIPANEDRELESVIAKMLEANPKVKKVKASKL
ncbi:MAG: hypothetical protein JXQ76_13075 [Campylobacterales bacterium]|nr:hypothetical protein [Campylobacterales bacterium]